MEIIPSSDRKSSQRNSVTQDFSELANSARTPDLEFDIEKRDTSAVNQSSVFDVDVNAICGNNWRKMTAILRITPLYMDVILFTITLAYLSLTKKRDKYDGSFKDNPARMLKFIVFELSMLMVFVLDNTLSSSRMDSRFLSLIKMILNFINFIINSEVLRQESENNFCKNNQYNDAFTFLLIMIILKMIVMIGKLFASLTKFNMSIILLLMTLLMAISCAIYLFLIFG
jgi:hypothetical protein